MRYDFLKPFLFRINPEHAHTLSLTSLNVAYRLGVLPSYSTETQAVTAMGLTFPNRLGLAAGLDKNADYIEALGALGFGFIEIGTVTPRPQPGNPKPRLFRLVNEEAIINRMGFNSKGVEYVVNRLKQSQFRGILGVNIGKNKDTPNNQAIDDYRYGFRMLAPFASYVTINISSPNTQGLRDLQNEENLAGLLKILKADQATLAKSHRYVPLVVKLSPDLADEEIAAVASVLLEQRIDGVIATNTTLSREGVERSLHANETGGLSGRPLTARSTTVIRKLHDALKAQIPIIASGGVMDKASAEEKLRAGATLVQVYTGFIYKGPEIITDLYRCE